MNLPKWKQIRRFYYILLIFAFFLQFKLARSTTQVVDAGHSKETKRYPVASFHPEHVGGIYAITLWILLGALSIIAFESFSKWTHILPESCFLCVLGLLVGLLFYLSKLAEEKSYVLNSETFFLFLLPPIILDAGYFMPNRPFLDNIGTIILFAVVNTLFNTLCIGGTLYGFNFTPVYGGTHFEMLHCFVFAALISAVDPVAVLATFCELHVNDMLYIIVFGESLLNDAVSVVLYRLFDGLTSMGAENILPVDLALGAASFFVVALGGVIIGLIFGAIACFTTKFTNKAAVLEPLIVVTFAYLSYLTAEMTSTSGILAITFCGMLMKQYVSHNVNKKSNSAIEYLLKMMSKIMETIIFVFMGVSVSTDLLKWNTGFVLLTFAACTVFRCLGVLIFGTIANRWRLIKIEFKDMIIMSYGGIRGAVAFALALILEDGKYPNKREFVTATIFVVFITIFVQGSTIGKVLKFLDVKLGETEEPKDFVKFSNKLIENLMSGFEDVAGVVGTHKIRSFFRDFSENYVQPMLMNEGKDRRKKFVEKYNLYENGYYDNNGFDNISEKEKTAPDEASIYSTQL